MSEYDQTFDPKVVIGHCGPFSIDFAHSDIPMVHFIAMDMILSAKIIKSSCNQPESRHGLQKLLCLNN